MSDKKDKAVIEAAMGIYRGWNLYADDGAFIPLLRYFRVFEK